MRTYYLIDNKAYYINLVNLFSVVSEATPKEKIVNTTITQYYGDNDSDNNDEGGKEIVESKSSVNESMCNVRYDFIKHLFDCLFGANYTMSGVPTYPMKLEELSLSQKLCMNTLIEYKILIEVNADE